MAHFLPVQTMGISVRSSKTGNRLLWPSSSEALPQPVWWFMVFRQNVTRPPHSLCRLISEPRIQIGASQNTYFIRQRKYCSEEEKTPKINFLSYIISSHTRRRKVTKYIKEKTNIAKTARGSPPQRGFGWMLQHGPKKNPKTTARLVKAEHDLRQFLILHATKKHWDERGRWHCSGGVICSFTRVRQISKHEASKWITWAKRGGRYTKKSGPLDGEDDGGLGTERSLSRVIRNLLKEAEREGSWGRLFGSFFFFSDRSSSRGGKIGPAPRFFSPRVKPKTRQEKRLAPTLNTHTCTQPGQTRHNQTGTQTCRLLYKGRTLQSHADGMFRYFCSLTQMCFAAWSLFLLERELL